MVQQLLGSCNTVKVKQAHGMTAYIWSYGYQGRMDIQGVQKLHDQSMTQKKHLVSSCLARLHALPVCCKREEAEANSTHLLTAESPTQQLVVAHSNHGHTKQMHSEERTILLVSASCSTPCNFWHLSCATWCDENELACSFRDSICDLYIRMFDRSLPGIWISLKVADVVHVSIYY